MRDRHLVLGALFAGACVVSCGADSIKSNADASADVEVSTPSGPCLGVTGWDLVTENQAGVKCSVCAPHPDGGVVAPTPPVFGPCGDAGATVCETATNVGASLFSSSTGRVRMVYGAAWPQSPVANQGGLLVVYDTESKLVIDELATDCLSPSAQIADDTVVANFPNHSIPTYTVMYSPGVLLHETVGSSSWTKLLDDPSVPQNSGLGVYFAGTTGWVGSAQGHLVGGDYIGSPPHAIGFQDIILQWVGDRMLTLDKGALNLRDVNGGLTTLVSSGVQSAGSDGHDLVWLEAADGGASHVVSSPYSTDPSQLVRHAVRDVASGRVHAVGCGFAAFEAIDGTDLLRLTDGAHWHIGYSGNSIAIGHCASGGDLWIAGNPLSTNNAGPVTKIGIASLGAPN